MVLPRPRTCQLSCDRANATITRSPGSYLSLSESQLVLHFSLSLHVTHSSLPHSACIFMTNHFICFDHPLIPYYILWLISAWSTCFSFLLQPLSSTSLPVCESWRRIFSSLTGRPEMAYGATKHRLSTGVKRYVCMRFPGFSIVSCVWYCPGLEI